MTTTIENPEVQRELENRIRVRTGKRVRNLEIRFAPDRVELLGETSTYHVKQLAQHGVLEFLPSVQLHNYIVVP